MRIKNMTNEQLLNHYENLCFRITNYSKNKTIASEFKKARKEMENRLGITNTKED